MGIGEQWGSVDCPNCGKKTFRVWVFDGDCRWNNDSWGGHCRSCGHDGTDEEIRKGLQENNGRKCE